MGTVNNGNRFPPVTLAGEYPVAQLVVHRLLSHAHFLHNQGRFLFKLCGFPAVPVPGIDHFSAGLRIGLRQMFNLFAVLGNDLDNGNVKFGGKLKVPVVVGGNAHDGTRTVIRQHVIGKPDGKLGPVHRIDCIAACENTCLLFILDPVHIGTHGRPQNIGFHILPGLVGGQSFGQGMLRRKDHKGRAVKGIGTGGVDGNLLVSALHREIHLRTVGFSDPVGLHLFHFLRPVQLIQII